MDSQNFLAFFPPLTWWPQVSVPHLGSPDIGAGAGTRSRRALRGGHRLGPGISGGRGEDQGQQGFGPGMVFFTFLQCLLMIVLDYTTLHIWVIIMMIPSTFFSW